MTHEKIAVLDFGGQYAHLIANRIRRLGVYSEILDPETPADQLKSYKGIILSGGPQSVYDDASPRCEKTIFDLRIPILGICYGHQLMQHLLGGKVSSGQIREYGMANLQLKSASDLFKKESDGSRVWMSHFDLVTDLAPGFRITAQTSDCPVAAIENPDKKQYGLQFHPEVTHTEKGMELLDQFLSICQVSRDWSIDQFIQEEIAAIQKKVGDKKVFLLVSGGVDSTVCFALLEKALGSDRVYGLLVDTGLMRYQEAEKVTEALKKAGFTNLHVADEKERFLSALKSITEPEEKRKIIGDLFLKVKEDAAKKLNLNPDEWMMGQGTIYPDTIETGGTKHAHTIKTHHNRVDAVQKMIDQGLVIEPIAQLYKDEVRRLGEALGLDHDLIWRQPFPGPGLGVRILCANDQEAKKLEDFTELSSQITNFIKNQFKTFQTRAVVLPTKSVGVQGDERTYKNPVALFWGIRDWNKLEKMATAIPNNFPQVNRVMLALFADSNSFVLNPFDINEQRVKLLQKIDDRVSKIMQSAEKDYGIWQFPVVLAPVGSTDQKESIILRPIVSTEAMTASFARIDWNLIDQLAQSISEEPSISHIFYDLTHKPPGTIEWE